jgi:tetratricopeptide (TPR) repeat protein
VWHKDGQSITSFPLEGHSSKINAIAFSPDGKTVASGGADTMVKLWNLDGRLIATLEGHASEVNAIAFSPDGKTIASGSKDKMVKLWNLDGRLIATLEGHASEVNAIAFSPDGKTIASGSSDNTVKLWQHQHDSSTLIHTFLSHNGPIYALAFSPDGKTLVSGSEDKTVKLWNLNLDELITLACKWLEEYNISRPDRFSQLESCQTPQRLQASALSLVAQGEQLVKTGKFEEAIDKFERAKQWNPKLTFDSRQKAGPALVKQAQDLVLEGKHDEAIYKLKEAKTLDPNLDLNPDTEEVETDAEIVANQFAAVKKRGEARTLAIEGNLDEAIARFKEAQTLDPNIDLIHDTETVETDAVTVVKKFANQFAAVKKRGEATTLAREGNLDEAIARFEEAQTLDPNLDLNPDTAEVETDAATVAKQFAARNKHEEGTKLVKEGQLDKAIAKFKEAQNLNPDIDLISDNSDEQYKQPEMAVRYLAAIEKFKEGESLANMGKIDEAIALFKESQNLDSNVEQARSWNTLCRFGALQGRAAEVLFACETAVSLEPKNGDYKDSRGLARALTGNTEGAIEDFQAFLDSTDDNSAQFWRKEWIYYLRNDKNPFTEQELQRLLEE